MSEGDRWPPMVNRISSSTVKTQLLARVAIAPTPGAVRTAVSVRRWTNLWRSVNPDSPRPPRLYLLPGTLNHPLTNYMETWEFYLFSAAD